MRALIVDIGSNSIRAMEAEHTGNGVGFFDKRVFTTRLAEGLLRSGKLSEARMDQSLAVLRTLKDDADQGCMPLFAYATSAVRDAENRQTFLDRAEAVLSRPVDVLSGETEARFAYLGATGLQGGLLDIGGGSTQLITADCAFSFPLGCVRAKDAAQVSDDSDTLYNMLLPLMESTFDFEMESPRLWTGVGGTVTTLAAIALGLGGYDRVRVSNSTLSIENVQNTLRRIAGMGLQRASHPLLKERHDIILPGGMILLYLMNRLSIKRLHVSDADGMEGFAIRLFSTMPAHAVNK